MVASASAVGIFGANWSVVQALASVNFLPGSFGEMQGSVAYIRRWSRRGIADTSQPLQPSSFDFVSRDSVNEGLSAQLRSRLPVLNFNPLTQNAITGPNFSATAPNPSSFFPTSADAQQAFASNVSSFFPTSANAQQAFAPNFSRPAPVPTLGTQLPPAPRASFGNLLGQIFSANPSGQFFGAFAPRTPTPYTGKAAPRRVPSIQLGGTVGHIPVTSSLPPGQWQFLFNPSELQIDAGPEFQKAETWGVSDKANSGQPLHWTHNKNVELKFNEILLNGYVFGKQVESLEQGLFDLFMARGDRSQAGPDILEFVWGKRVFGPCVIKNVSVKEKAWDNGLVVNATVSFTLEQIPEWTINDGEFVDVARPGREAFIGNPAVPSSNALASQSPDSPPAAPAPPATSGAPQSSDQKPPTTPPATDNSPPQCQRAFFYTGNLAQLKTLIQQRGPAFGTPRGQFDTWLSQMVTTLDSVNAELAGWSGLARVNTTQMQRNWDGLKARDTFLKFNTTDKINFLVGTIQSVQNSLGSRWNNSTLCPNTAR